MSRRQWLLLLGGAIATLRADEREELLEWLGHVVSHLSEEATEEFLRAFHKDLRRKIETSVRAMMATAEVSSTVDILSIEGSGQKRGLDLDWFMDLRPRAESTPNEIRRIRVKMHIERASKGWLITGFSPLDLFGPPRQ